MCVCVSGFVFASVVLCACVCVRYIILFSDLRYPSFRVRRSSSPSPTTIYIFLSIHPLHLVHITYSSSFVSQSVTILSLKSSHILTAWVNSTQDKTA